MKTIVNAQELTRLVEQSQHFFTSVGGINLPASREMMQRALLEPPKQCIIGYVGGILFVYNWGSNGTGN